MQYPLISEYIEAIRSAEENFAKLANLRPVLDDNGNPIMSSGNFAVVFKMRDVSTGRLFAVKCFIKEQEGRSERYAKIAEELQFVSSPYILHVQYIDSELFVNSANCDEEEFPVLVMDWVDGQPLDAYLRENLDEEYALQMLAYRFCNMGAWLLSQPFAHGDLKPDNILVRDDGSLVLVDYDGMFVPSMKGEKAYEIGSPDFRYPQRTADDFDEQIDDFSIASIALSLKAIALDSQLYHKYAAADRLLFSAADYRDIGKTSAIQAIVGLSSNADLSLLLGLFLLALSKNSLSSVSFRIFLLQEPEKPIVEMLSTEITYEERKNAVEDVFGAKYTEDGIKLIHVPYNLCEYIIKNGIKIIGDNVFNLCHSITSIIIPDSVTIIGSESFASCYSLTSIILPNSVISIGEEAFEGCYSLNSITIPESVRYIGGGVLNCCTKLCNVLLNTTKYSMQDSMLFSIGNEVISCWSKDSHIILPMGVTAIGNRAFKHCYCLTSIIISETVTSIGDSAFEGCKSLTSIIIPETVTSIGDSAFKDCESLTSIIIPETVTSIGNRAFEGCGSLDLITIPGSLTSIGDMVFKGCCALDSITIPETVTSIGDGAFEGCGSLTSIIVPNSVLNIGGWAFRDCCSITSVTIPETVTSIGDSAFEGCESITSITIPETVTSIGDSAFKGCKSLTSITIPETVTSIGDGAFKGCN